eukprot:CAMPEP_0172493102 /NCGR_PEP_ID=MMETSP1066-20121228/24448_1 /TAXON_ID=671091 /ORGANISM="Coscinodiscus wailesii, Strain CCMP2513" /LENGTH=163 /DNA_ID=CAMNT_0013263091 /DNA_START=163 /DNA_END=654 /DNA_ORIENTATION=-
MMGTRRGKGGLKNNLDGSKKALKSTKALNKGKGQELLGVTPPNEGQIKGWQFGKRQTIACAKVNGRYYAIQGECPRCAFDLYRGTLVTDEVAFGPDVPRVACPTCSTTFSLKTGAHGPALKKSGLSAWVGGLAQTATVSDAMKDARAFAVTVDEEGKVYCRDV